MDRRNFLKTTSALCGLSLASAAFIESCTKDNTSANPQGPSVNFTIDLSQPANSSLNTSGGSLASHGVVVANTVTGYVAIAQSCTHEGCSIGYNQNSNNFVCPCHGGTFDTSGNVISGPPPAPLKIYTVTQNGDILTIAG
jgi:cytochrome b6-f complex iron-sulfur subunit